MIKKIPCVYIVSSGRNGTLYIGVTSDPIKRIWEHKNKVVKGFTDQYGISKLVWYETHEMMDSAIRREKNLKKWNRRWKLRLIEEKNPEWIDLYENIASGYISS